MDFDQTSKLWREFLRIRRIGIFWGRIQLIVQLRDEPIGLEEACIRFGYELLRLHTLAHDEPKQARKAIVGDLERRYIDLLRSLKPSEHFSSSDLFGLYLYGFDHDNKADTKQARPTLLRELDHLLSQRQLSRSLKSHLAGRESECRMELSKINPSLDKARAALYAIVDELDEDQPPYSNQVYDAACLLKEHISHELITIIVSAWKRELRGFIKYYSHAPYMAESYYFWGDSQDGSEFLDAVSHYRMMECFGIGDFPETMRSVEKHLEEDLMGSILEERSIPFDLWIASRSESLSKKANQLLVQKALNFIVAEQHEDGWMAPSTQSYERTNPEPSTYYTALGTLVIFKLGQDSALLEKGKRAINWLTKQQHDSGAWTHYHTKWRRARRYKGGWTKPKATVVLIEDLLTTVLAVDAIRRSGLSGYDYTLQKAEDWILSQQRPEGLWTEQADDEEGGFPDIFVTTLVLEYFDSRNKQDRIAEAVGPITDKGESYMKSKILFLAADARNETRLRLMQEFREIEHNLQMSTARDNFQLCTPELSVRKQDLSRRLLQERPRIVHFSGHGTPDGSLCFEGDDGNSQYVEPTDLDLLFELHANYVDCVILNACYAAKQAEAISQHINCVIGMSKKIEDRAAIDFAIGFYQAIGEGKSIDEAYKHGCALIASKEKIIPVLLRKTVKP